MFSHATAGFHCKFTGAVDWHGVLQWIAFSGSCSARARSCWSGSGGSALAGCSIIGVSAPAACLSAATTPGAVNTLNSVGCYVSTNGKSVLIPPALGTIGNSGRNSFRDLGFKNWDVPVLKETKFKERLTAQFRAEFFNVFNHANFLEHRRDSLSEKTISPSVDPEPGRSHATHRCCSHSLPSHSAADALRHRSAERRVDTLESQRHRQPADGDSHSRRQGTR